MAMDFSFLDLLASTALRDNNQSVDKNNASADPHLQQNHLSSEENEEEDDETDGKDKLKNIESENLSAVAKLQEKDMGSVKCGKPKKTSVKSVSIYVRDGKCVAKEIPTDTKCNGETGGQVKGHLDMIVPDQVNSRRDQEELCESTADTQLHVRPIMKAAKSEVLLVASELGLQTDSSSDKAVVSAEIKENNQHTAATDDIDDVAVSCDSATREASCQSSTECFQATSGDSLHMALESDQGYSEGTSTYCDEFKPFVEASCDSHVQSDATSSGYDQVQVTMGDSEGISAVGKRVQDLNTCDAKLSGSVIATNSSLKKLPCGQENFILSQSSSGEVEKGSDLGASGMCEDTVALQACSSLSDVARDGQTMPDNSVDQAVHSRESKDTGSVDTILLLPPPPPPVSTISEAIFADHNYFSHPKQCVENTDDSGDAFESADENVSADEIEHRPRSLSVDSVYLQSGISGLPQQQEALLQNEKYALLSPTLSVDSVSNDSSVSENSAVAGGQCYSLLVGSSNPVKTVSQYPAAMDNNLSDLSSLPPVSESNRLTFNLQETTANSSVLDNSVLALAPKCGKFRIGTVGSFSNSHLDLEKESKKAKVKLPLSAETKTFLSSSIAYPASPFPLVQSPGLEWDRSDAGSEEPDDMDSSTTEDKFLSSSHDSEAFESSVKHIWNHPVFHDHDYCCKEVSEKYLGKPAVPTHLTKGGKRKYVKKKDRKDVEEDKLKKGKYLKRELLKRDNRFNLDDSNNSNSSVDNRTLTVRPSLLAESLMSKPNPVGRPRKRKEKQVEEYDAETGTKMKITGKYQDQYVYYLNKSSRSRRRKLDEKLSHGDRIILPAPKPGDIVVPHLTDADCEAIRYGGRMALNASSLPTGTASLPPHSDNGDMDSSIVNTILSMETEHGNVDSALSNYDDASEFGDFEGNLTSEQVQVLFECLDTYHMEETSTSEGFMEETSTSEGFDLFTSAEVISAPPTALNSLTATTVDDEFLVPDSQTNLGIMPSSGSDVLGDKVDTCSSADGTLETEAAPSLLSPDTVHSNPTSVVSSDVPVVPTCQPSVERNLAFLKTPFTKSDLFPTVSSVPSTYSSTDLVSPTTSVIGSSKSEDANETPWIVTVTLYWNDIPAIIINNMPHVRLVDIHRQILPAKDTGILKKRCQLMSIQVSNCTEMQRYFLVQYGRAHNSKSTLVISKDEAQRLIAYYVHPPPRNTRGEEGAGLRRTASYAELRSIMERPSNDSHHSSLAFSQPRKRGGFRRRGMAPRSHNPSPERMASASSPRLVPFSTPAKGLRHKKINFREMLKGEDSSPPRAPTVFDSPVEDEPVVADPVPTARGRGAKGSGRGRGIKRRVNKDGEGGSPGKRSRKEWRKETGKEPVQPTVDQTQSEVDGDATDNSSVAVKQKKRSPANGSLSTSNRSPKSKFGPIKVNVKSLVHLGGSFSPDNSFPRKKNLFGRKSSITDVVVDMTEETPLSHPLRILRISHQDAEAESSSGLEVLSPTPMAEVHLDLYKRASSPCVKCGTCEKFLSVPGFLKHQHVNGEDYSSNGNITHDVISNHRRRMLVPMNKENISLEEQHLWNEFVALQESLDHSTSVSSMGAYPLTPLSPQSPVGSSVDGVYMEKPSPAVVEVLPEALSQNLQGINHLHNGHDGLVPLSESDSVFVRSTRYVTSPDHGCAYSDIISVEDPVMLPETAAHPWEPQISVCSPPTPLTHTNTEEKFLDITETDHVESPSPPQTVVVPSKKQQPMQRNRRTAPQANIRSSSRKRETKRLYSFEKYEFAGATKKNVREESDSQDLVDDLPETFPGGDLKNVLGNSAFPLIHDSTFQESHNA